MMSWANYGWDEDPSNKGGGNVNQMPMTKVFRYWMTQKATRRLLFLDSPPCKLYEHNLYNLGQRENAICLRRNNIEESCPLCDCEVKGVNYAYEIGYFTVIEIGEVVDGADGRIIKPVVSKKGKEYQFTRKMYGAKFGSQENPGVMSILKRKAMKHGGSLEGTVWDVYRSGEKKSNVGDEFDFVEKVNLQDWSKYLIHAGCQEAEIDREQPDGRGFLEPVDYLNVLGPPDDVVAMYHGLVGNSKAGSSENTDWKGEGARTEGSGW